MSAENVKAFIKYISSSDKQELLKSLDEKSTQEISVLAQEHGFKFEVQELVSTVEEIKKQHFAKEPPPLDCKFLSAVADSAGWACR